MVRCITLRKVCLKTCQEWLTSVVERIEVQGIDESNLFIVRVSAWWYNQTRREDEGEEGAGEEVAGKGRERRMEK